MWLLTAPLGREKIAPQLIRSFTFTRQRILFITVVFRAGMRQAWWGGGGDSKPPPCIPSPWVWRGNQKLRCGTALAVPAGHYVCPIAGPLISHPSVVCLSFLLKNLPGGALDSHGFIRRMRHSQLRAKPANDFGSILSAKWRPIGSRWVRNDCGRLLCSVLLDLQSLWHSA